uniref:GYF domain-containing protein n=1 Tax=Ditylenchus dipsaci TaxID=166011 RepID=A0A915EVK1_9BILA
MNGQISTSFPTTNWFYVGQDERIYGPHASAAMLKWAHVGYFTDHLMLRTERDERWYPLQEWVRACGNQLPFLLPIESMDDALRGTMRGMNNAASREQIYSPPPAMLQPNGLPHLQQPPPQQPAYISYPNQMPFMEGQAMSAPPQALLPAMAHVPEPYRGGHSNGVADGESTASITPEEIDQLNYPPVRASFPVCNKFSDTSDSPWNVKADSANDPILFQNHCSQGTQTNNIHLSQVQVERVLSDLLGLNITISPVKK